ncbi:MAG TPA: PQQ-binding-like beta-propeller repeat protein [Actinomycetota bacterium]
MSTDWPAYGLDHANSMHNLAEDTLSPENVAELREAWRLEGIGGVTGTPLVLDGVVYLADWHGAVHAVDAGDGEVLWQEQVADVPISGTVAITGEVVVVGDLGGVLHARDRGSGEKVWSTTLNPAGASLFASPVVIEDTVVIGKTDTELERDDPDFRASIVAVDLEDGSERWRLHTDPGDRHGYWVPVWSSVAYDAERRLIYVGTGNTNQPEAGGAGGPGERAPIDLPLADGVLAIEQQTGEMAWFFKLIEEDAQRDFDVGASPNLFTVGGHDVVGAGGKSGDYVLLDRDTGEMIWKTHLSEGSAGGGVMSTAAVGDGVVYVGSNDAGAEGTIFALAAEDGSIIWERALDEPIIGGSMAMANGVLYRGTWGGSVLALDAEDGTVLWAEDLDAPLAGGFSIVNGTLYVGYGAGAPPVLGPVDGGLVAYRLP